LRAAAGTRTHDDTGGAARDFVMKNFGMPCAFERLCLQGFLSPPADDEHRMNSHSSAGSVAGPIFDNRRRSTRKAGCAGRKSRKEKGVTIMKTFAKLAMGAVLAGGLAVAAAAPADAGVHVGIGVGVPGYAPYPAYYGGYYGCGPYADPYYCGYPGYYAPGYVGFGWGGGWGHGGYRGGYHGGGYHGGGHSGGHGHH
jgi:hypothetical protein